MVEPLAEIVKYEVRGGEVHIGHPGCEKVGASESDLYAVIILLDENGAVVNSNKVPVKRNDTSLSEVKSGVVAKIDYYDMNGRHIINPTGGIYLKVTTMENGSQSVSKIIIP